MKNSVLSMLGRAGVLALAFGSVALVHAADYSPVAYDTQTGDVSVTPSNLVAPLIGGIIAIFAAVAAIALVIKFGSMIFRWITGGR